VLLSPSHAESDQTGPIGSIQFNFWFDLKNSSHSSVQLGLNEVSKADGTDGVDGVDVLNLKF
jgi:hypothetical protein